MSAEKKWTPSRCGEERVERRLDCFRSRLPTIQFIADLQGKAAEPSTSTEVLHQRKLSGRKNDSAAEPQARWTQELGPRCGGGGVGGGVMELPSAGLPGTVNRRAAVKLIRLLSARIKQPTGVASSSPPPEDAPETQERRAAGAPCGVAPLCRLRTCERR